VQQFRSRKTAPVFNVFSNPFSVNALRAVTWSQVLRQCLIDTEKVFNGWEDSLQDGAFLQLGVVE